VHEITSIVFSDFLLERRSGFFDGPDVIKFGLISIRLFLIPLNINTLFILEKTNETVSK